MFQKQHRSNQSRVAYPFFWQQLRQNFKQTGAILPSSPALSHAMVIPLQSAIQSRHKPIHILEAGAGTGAFTQQILPLLRKGDQFDIVEINPAFTCLLQQKLHQTATFQMTQADIRLINADLCHFPLNVAYDFIVFSLPLVNFSPAMVEILLTQMMSCLKPNGIFSYFTYVFVGRMKRLLSSPKARLEVDRNRMMIQKFAQQYQIEKQVVPWNVGPAWVHYWRKDG